MSSYLLAADFFVRLGVMLFLLSLVACAVGILRTGDEREIRRGSGLLAIVSLLWLVDTATANNVLHLITKVGHGGLLWFMAVWWWVNE